MNLKEKIQNGKNICGTMVNIPAMCIAEMMGYFDYDYLWIDLEHSAITLDVCYAQIVAAKSVGKQVIVRVPQNDLTYTKKVLEMGPDGVIFPMVKNAKEAEQLLSYTLYPPFGNRGCGPQRAVRYGVDDEIAYFKSGAVDLCRFLQIECKTFVDELEQIASNPYIDGFILGLADLSGSINEIGEFFGENNLALAKKAIEIATKHNKIVGAATLATDEKTLAMLRDMGIKMITCGSDFNYIVNGARKTCEVLKKVLDK
jgi:2-dehydro-3-deoxyglucarate aldolase/4-hydroxy-2-oxoheptanedioate aldolase